MTANFPPRQYHTQQVHYLRGVVKYTDAGTAVKIGTLPDKAILLIDEMPNGAFVNTAFNGGGADTVDIGFSAYKDRDGNTVVADPNAFATALDVSTTGWKPCDETAAERYVNADSKGIPVTATYTDASSDASAGEARVVIAFIPPDANES